MCCPVSSLIYQIFRLFYYSRKQSVNASFIAARCLSGLPRKGNHFRNPASQSPGITPLEIVGWRSGEVVNAGLNNKYRTTQPTRTELKAARAAPHSRNSASQFWLIVSCFRLFPFHSTSQPLYPFIYTADRLTHMQ